MLCREGTYKSLREDVSERFTELVTFALSLESHDRLHAQQLFRVEVLLILWPTRVEPTCEKDGMEWLLPSPRFTPLSSTSTSSPNPILSKETAVHIIFLRVGEENGVQPESDRDIKRQVLKKDSINKWGASKVFGAKPPFFSLFSILCLPLSGLIKICLQGRI